MSEPSFVTKPTPTAAPITLPIEVTAAARDHAARRFDAAKAALTGLLAATPATTQATSNAEQYARSAVRYADALLEALNRTTAEAMSHARQR